MVKTVKSQSIIIFIYYLLSYYHFLCYKQNFMTKLGKSDNFIYEKNNIIGLCSCRNVLTLNFSIQMNSWNPLNKDMIHYQVTSTKLLPEYLSRLDL